MLVRSHIGRGCASHTCCLSCNCVFYELCSFSWVVLPMEYCLVVKEFSTLRIDDLFPECFVLKKLQKMKANWIFDKLNICGFLPVLQVLEVINEIGFLKVAALCQKIQIIWVPKTLHKFQLCLEPKGTFIYYVSTFLLSTATFSRIFWAFFFSSLCDKNFKLQHGIFVEM